MINQLNDLEGQKLCRTLIIQLPTTGLHSELVQYCSHIFTIRASEIPGVLISP